MKRVFDCTSFIYLQEVKRKTAHKDQNRIIYL